MTKFPKLSLTVLMLFAFVSCNDSDEQPVENPTLAQAATDAGLTTLISAVDAVPGLLDVLQSENSITVFAPSNDAFAAALNDFGVTSLDQLVTKIGGEENLQSVLGFHVVPAVAFSKDLSASNTFTTLAGQDLTVNVNGSAVTVTDAVGNTVNVIAADVAIDNGVVHVIDGVLLPALDLPNIVEAASAAELTVLLDAVNAAGVGPTLLNADEVTVFAPTNSAFAALLAELNLNSLTELVDAIGLEGVQKVLGFHVVPAVAFSFDLEEGSQSVPTLSGENLTVVRSGNEVTVTDAAGNTYRVVAADVAVENGVVHVIDGVLLPTL
jgi:transforming growth factor-beta-induced protein